MKRRDKRAGQRKCWKGKKGHADVVWKCEKKRQRLKNGRKKDEKWLEKKTNAWETLYSVCSTQHRAKPALLADISSFTLSSPPASPPFLLLLSSCYPPPLSCMAHSCSSTYEDSCRSWNTVWNIFLQNWGHMEQKEQENGDRQVVTDR